jgi:hypothetical protein
MGRWRNFVIEEECNMADENFGRRAEDHDLRRRVERLEMLQSESQLIIRESALMVGRLNETLLDFKQELTKIKDNDLKDLARMKVSLSIVHWIGGSIGATGLSMILIFLFKTPA